MIPGVLTIVALVLAQSLIWLDHRLWGTGSAPSGSFVFGGGVDGSRGVLSAISSSLITVTGTVFSLTIVALQLASGQMTPRLLRNFTGDRTVQVVLGILVGTFTYSVMVLRVIRSEDSESEAFVPALATTVAIALALISVGALIAFVHHVSRLIRVDVVVARIAEDNVGLISTTDPLPEGALVGSSSPDDSRATAPVAVMRADRSGYIQAIDRKDLFATCDRSGAFVRVTVAAGDFVLDGATLAEFDVDPEAGDQVERDVRRAIVLGDEQTGQEDRAFPVRQLADIALRALSPGVNDPTTAMTCIDRLGELLAAAAQRDAEPEILSSPSGRGTLVLRPGPDLSSLIETAFTQIRHYGANDTLVMARAVQTLVAVMGVAPPAARPPLREEALRYLASMRRSASDDDRPIVDRTAALLGPPVT